MALDIYAWLAQRLCRIPSKSDALVPWFSLHEQFGSGYKQIRQFRKVFLDTLKDVLSQYPAAHASPLCPPYRDHMCGDTVQSQRLVLPSVPTAGTYGTRYPLYNCSLALNPMRRLTIPQHFDIEECILPFDPSYSSVNAAHHCNCGGLLLLSGKGFLTSTTFKLTLKCFTCGSVVTRVNGNYASLKSSGTTVLNYENCVLPVDDVCSSRKDTEADCCTSV